MTYAVNSLLQKIKLFSFTHLISQKFSDTAEILAFAVSKRCTQDLPVVNTQDSSAGFFVFLPFGIPEKKIKELFFRGIADFRGTIFNLLPPFLGIFRLPKRTRRYVLFG